MTYLKEQFGILRNTLFLQELDEKIDATLTSMLWATVSRRLA